MTPAGLTLIVRVTPNASRSAILSAVTLADGSAVLPVRLRAPPVDGAANDALVALLAETLGVRRSAITIASGATGRLKRLAISGDGAALAAQLSP